MRLSCPSCAASYDVPAAMIPAAGKHVQCSACHTRWFAHGPADRVQPVLTEDQIIARLETRSARPRLVSAPFRDAQSDASGAEEPAAPAGPAENPAPGPATKADPATSASQDARPAAPRSAERGAAAKTKPGEGAAPSAAILRPRVPAEAGDGAPVPPRQNPARPAEAPRSGGGRFAAGFLASLALFALAVAAYVEAEALAERMPGAAPYLRDYVEAVDAARARAEIRLAPVRAAIG